MITEEQFLEFLDAEIIKKQKLVKELEDSFRQLQASEKKLKCLKEAAIYLAETE